MLKQTSDDVIAELKAKNVNVKKDRSMVHEIVDRILLPHVDIRGMARSALGRTVWKKASAAQRNKFSNEFITLMIRTYSGALVAYSDERIKFLPIRGGYDGKRRVKVNSRTMVGPPRITMNDLHRPNVDFSGSERMRRGIPRRRVEEHGGAGEHE